jgi:hydrogenase nickel incorporation protein HypA/HybF
MHELALATAIRDTVVRHAEGRQVSTVRLKVGGMRQVAPESLDFYFGVVAQGTVCNGSRLEVEVIPSALRCEVCGAGWRPESPSFRCPSCGGREVEVVRGGELEVESIDVEEKEVAGCIEPR